MTNNPPINEAALLKAMEHCLEPKDARAVIKAYLQALPDAGNILISLNIMDENKLIAHGDMTIRPPHNHITVNIRDGNMGYNATQIFYNIATCKCGYLKTNSMAIPVICSKCGESVIANPKPGDE